MAACLFPVSQALRGHYGKEMCSNFVDYAQLDAFTEEAFRGNPAVVCLLPIARSKEWMQNVAAEFNAPMTAFLVNRSNLENVSSGNGEDVMNGESHAGVLSNILHTPSEEKVSEYDVRFFLPVAEVELCGHATLASAYLLFKSGLARGSCVIFHTESGVLIVKKITGGEEWQGQVELSLPLLDSTVASTEQAKSILPRTLQGCKVVSAHKSRWERLLLELPSAKEVEMLEPCFEEISSCDMMAGGLIVTGKGTAESHFDFVSRFFAPKFGIPEDPVCGTAHCALAPFWAAKLGKQKLLAYQASKRGGVLDLSVDHASGRVRLRGTAVIVATGVISS